MVDLMVVIVIIAIFVGIIFVGIIFGCIFLVKGCNRVMDKGLKNVVNEVLEGTNAAPEPVSTNEVVPTE